MKIGIVDADLIGRHKHRFPNLVCEKLSGYWKERGAEVTLLMDYLFASILCFSPCIRESRLHLS